MAEIDETDLIAEAASIKRFQMPAMKCEDGIHARVAQSASEKFSALDPAIGNSRRCGHVFSVFSLFRLGRQLIRGGE